MPGPSTPTRTKNRARSRGSARRSRRASVVHGWVGGWSLEERCLLAPVPGQVEFPLAPTNTFGKYNTVGNLSDVLTTVASSAPYQKTITITNSSDKVMFAFLEGENTHEALAAPVDYSGTASYDPYDPLNQEYRGYVGTTDGTNDYAGIPPHSSVTVTVPLAFWDSGRINISTDGADQFTTYQSTALNQLGEPAGAPFNYLNADTQAIFFGTISTVGGETRLNFTPVYNSFVGGVPSTANWKSPVTSGLFKPGQTYQVTGAGLAAQTVTIDASHPNYVVLPTTVPATTTVAQYTFEIKTDPGNPGNVNPVTISQTARYVQTGLPLDTTGSAATTNGVVMWYHSLVGLQPNNLAPFQLTELTFRGTFYDATKNPGTDFAALLNSNDYAGAINNLADYDVSYVDSVNLPVAMEATNASVGNTGTTAPFGWIGSGMSVEAFQGALTAFASNNTAGGGNTNGLGTYFGGQGYPTYLPLSTGSVKLPAGQNLFLQGPASPGSVSDIHFVKTFPDNSVINQPLLELTSGGTAPPSFIIGGDSTHPTQGQDLGLHIDDANTFAIDNFITQAGTKYDVTYVVDGKTKLAGIVSGLYFGPDGTTLFGVKLDRAVPADATPGLVYTFTRETQDYAGGAIAGLWYSWAQYYVNHVTSSVPPTPVPGTLNGSLLTLNSAAPGLVPGMAVTSGANLPPGCVILSISPDHKTIQLSTVATGNPTTFSFAKPDFNTIVGFDKALTPLVNLSFDTATPQEKATALAFAQTVYMAMSAWSVSVPAGTANAWNPLLANIIGGNVGPAFLPHTDAAARTALTNITKSVQRGVPDFTSPQYADQALWYPDPALATGGLTYNAFNLNPVVWFIHQKLGAIVYAFSLDDELGNVNAGGATNVAIDIGGLDGFANLNQDQYSNTSNFGIVTSPALPTQARSSVVQATAANLNAKLFPFNSSDKTPGTMVNGPGVAVGTSLHVLTPSLLLNNPLSTSSTNPTFSFFGAPIFTGTVLGPGQATGTIILGVADANGNFSDQALAAYNSLLKMQPWANIEVNGEGIAPPVFGSSNPTPVTIQNVTKTATAITVTLSASLDPKLVSQQGASYGYTFGDPALGLILDPGFEWANVNGISGNFNHGAQLTQNTKDWTFTDESKSRFAGIAFDNTSTYTSSNPKAPQGLQVGFVQGTSSISQSFIAGVGEYALTLNAAQSGTFSSAQTLAILVDGVQVGTIPPQKTAYQPITIQFALTTSGQHTIMLKGMQASDSTVLIDALSVSTVSALAAPVPVTLDTIPNQSVVDGSTDTFTAHASGLSSPLIYSLAPGAPGGAKIDPDTGVFTWTPTTPGTYSITVQVSDDSLPALTDEQVVTITVSKATAHAAVVANLAKPTYGQSLFFDGAVASVPGIATPTGTIRFVVDGSFFGQPVPISDGSALSLSFATFGAGVHHAAAVYSGDANYAAVVSPILTVNIAQAPLNIVASSGSRAYGGANPAIFAAGFGFVAGQSLADLTGVLSVTTTAGPGSHVGSYPVIASGLTSSNYAITYVNGVIAVTPAILAIRANDQARVYGQPNPLLTASYAGFVNGDTPASLTTPVVLTTVANPFSPVGTYAITAGGASSPDYAITFFPGTLAVTPLPAGASPTVLRWAAFTTTLYQEILGRNPDALGFTFWVQALDRGVSPATVAASFWNSREHVLLLATNRAPRVALATALIDAQTAGQIAFGLASIYPRGPLSLAGASLKGKS